jgi:hypothetical protein
VEYKAHRVRLVQLVQLVVLVHPVQLDLLGDRVVKEKEVNRAVGDQRVVPVLTVLQDHLVLMVQLVQLDQPAVLPVQWDLLDHKG